MRSVDEFLEGQPPELHPIFTAVIQHVSGLPGAVVEPGEAYLMLKRRRKFAALIARRKWVRMWLILPNAVQDDRVQSHAPSSGRGIVHYLQLAMASDFDEVVRGWLTASYEAHG